MSKKFMQFTKGSAQVKVSITVQGNTNLVDIEELEAGASHKGYDNVSVIFGEYYQAHKFNEHVTNNGLYKIKNLMKLNQVHCLDMKTNQVITLPKLITSAKMKTHFDIGSMYAENYCTEAGFNYYGKRLKKAFGSFDVIMTDNQPDYAATVKAIIDSNIKTDAAKRILQNHANISARMNSLFFGIKDSMIQSRMEHDLIQEQSYRFNQLLELMDLIEVTMDELNEYQSGNNFSEMTYAVPNYGVNHQYAGNGSMRALQSSYVTYYKGNKYASNNVTALEAKLSEYIARKGFDIYIPTYQENVERFHELKALANRTAEQQHQMDKLDFELGITLVGSTEVIENAVYTHALTETDEYKTYQEVAEDEKSLRDITANTDIAKTLSKSSATAFDNMIKRQHSFQ